MFVLVDDDAIRDEVGAVITICGGCNCCAAKASISKAAYETDGNNETNNTRIEEEDIIIILILIIIILVVVVVMWL